MIHVRKDILKRHAEARGYSDVEGCITQDHGDGWVTVDERHPAYPHRKRPPAPEQGPGTELKRLLAGFPLYIKTSPGCKCNQRAKYMDQMGCDWCEQHIPEIVGWLQEEHERRKMLVPFSESLAALVVKRAIRSARTLSP